MTDKRRPSYLLTRIKSAFADPDALNRTVSATMGAEDLDMDAADVTALVQGLTRAGLR